MNKSKIGVTMSNGMAYKLQKDLLTLRRSIVFWDKGATIIDQEGTFSDEFNPQLFLFPSRLQENAKSEFNEATAMQLSSNHQNLITGLLELIHKLYCLAPSIEGCCSQDGLIQSQQIIQILIQLFAAIVEADKVESYGGQARNSKQAKNELISSLYKIQTLIILLSPLIRMSFKIPLRAQK